jgi:hypothetical protein
VTTFPRHWPLSRHGLLWRVLFDPVYRTPAAFAIPVVVAIVFAVVMGAGLGWPGVLIGMLLGLSLEIPLALRDLLIRWATRKRD